ncbi:DEAD/DEAH box helicase [Paenibacillus sp. SC116]|uniref:DEAD/DEAH box helicase n=1 Tax=Paenibacillus sp. SC116 TaxID=2968986 RepID=UPI00215AB81C|nr:DEAD/DEAH box helicase [Paenibacillus sp. SC116]MCR8844926.1 DEAD/DEAH box helicase [Paenibacillus sp. SC116]
MNKAEKSKFTQINKITQFNEVIKKITTNAELSTKEQSYILSCAIVFIKTYELDKRHTSYLQFGYYILLKYSLNYSDYQPLYDFSINFGFYPIAREILNKGLLNVYSINNDIIDMKMDGFEKGNYLETYEQKIIRDKMLNDTSLNVSFVAPTSFGKSSIIVEHILNNDHDKVVIIVPTKSLLVQTYRAIRQSEINRRIIIHDEMFQGEERFIAILTQERALRVLDKNDIFFNVLFIDEAHNLLERDYRSILLSRVIRKNLARNPSQKVVYLSPLVNDSSNLKISSQENISEQRIKHNVKEPEIFEYRKNGEAFQYNRFVNEFYAIDFFNSYLDYIKEKKGCKNFIYIRNPKKIEAFAKELASKMDDLDKSEEIEELVSELRDFVHEDFYIIDLLSKGIIYLHGKIPDIVKEYLEFKFKELNKLIFVVANSVILEGINLPIDTLYILNTYSLQAKKLTNLIGRVNRLNEIFNKEVNHLNKLLPPIHFVNNDTYDSPSRNMENKIKLLRSSVFEDIIENPVLEKYDIERLNIDKKRKDSYIEKANKIIKNEELVLNDDNDAVSQMRKYFINSGIDNVYNVTDELLNRFIRNIEKLKDVNLIKEWSESDIINKVYIVFIKDFTDSIADFEFYRLSDIQARNYYKMYLFNHRVNSLRENIETTSKYFKRRIKEGNSLFYIGETYGEERKYTERYIDGGKEVYVDLSKKSDPEITNLAIVKLKIEDDFISYKLNKMVIALHDFKLISDEEYNLAIYGTKDEKTIKLLKTGLSINLISRLQADNQIINISFDENYNLKTNDSFEFYRRAMKGFYRFELDKYL